MNGAKLFLMTIFAVLLQACTTAGPFVTNITSDGYNGINIERCTVEMNAVFGGLSAIRNKDCTMQNLKIVNPQNQNQY